MLDSVREAVKNLVEKLNGKVGAVALFGSLARGEDEDRSVVDLFVVVKGMSKGLINSKSIGSGKRVAWIFWALRRDARALSTSTEFKLASSIS